MNTISGHTFFLLVWCGLAVITFAVLLRISAPYGRHRRRGWGPGLPNRIGWIMMELPALGAFAYFFLTGNTPKTAASWLFFGCWVLHYTYRSLIFPWRLPAGRKRMPLLIAGMAILFNSVNGYLNGTSIGSLLPAYPSGWFFHPAFLTGFALFATGLGLNWQADNLLLHLRHTNPDGYGIPHGGLFDLIACPNYFAEIIEWLGFAVMTLSPAAFAFLLWTAANLIPRALVHRRWYSQHFDNYPPERRAIFPGIL